jgi:head-tail adaptor
VFVGRERLTIQRNNAVKSVTSVTRSATTATATMPSAHGWSTGDYVTIAGASPSGYNGKKQITVTSATTFTYTVSGSLSTPATGTITATRTSNAQAGRADDWTTLATVPAEQLPLSASERLQVSQIAGETRTRFRIRSRPDLTGQMRVLWSPTWPPSAPQQTLEIHGLLPDDDGRFTMFLDCGRVS